MRFSSIFSAAFLLAAAHTSVLFGLNKIDAGPVYVHTDVLEHGKVKDKLDMYGARLDAALQLFPRHAWLCGLFAKPSIMYAGGDGQFFTAGIGMAFYVPVSQNLKLAPVVGISYTKLRSRTDFPELLLFGLRQRFTSRTPYVGLDGYYCLTDKWMFSGSIQYGFAKTRTDYEILGLFKGESSGFSYSAMVDYYFTKCWSINLALAYNRMLSQERHGNRSYGARLGLGYTY